MCIIGYPVDNARGAAEQPAANCGEYLVRRVLHELTTVGEHRR